MSSNGGRNFGTCWPEKDNDMAELALKRRKLIHALALLPVLRPSLAFAQSDIVQPAERTKAAFLAHARGLRDQAVREGDQAYGAVVVRAGLIVGEGRNFVVRENDPTAHAELLAVRDACRRLKTRDLSDCEVYSTATPCPMCRAALYWARVRRYHNESTAEEGVAPRLC
jgi:Cytidine and deoxycytidylate deaminase zinc-binding region